MENKDLIKRINENNQKFIGNKKSMNFLRILLINTILYTSLLVSSCAKPKIKYPIINRDSEGRLIELRYDFDKDGKEDMFWTREFRMNGWLANSKGDMCPGTSEDMYMFGNRVYSSSSRGLSVNNPEHKIYTDDNGNQIYEFKYDRNNNEINDIELIYDFNKNIWRKIHRYGIDEEAATIDYYSGKNEIISIDTIGDLTIKDTFKGNKDVLDRLGYKTK